MIASFPPIFDGGSRALILGSMPSVASLKKGQYYAHPRNAFWPLLFRLFGEPESAAYADRVSLLLRRGIALWDVYASCERVASGDGSIRGGVHNDIPRFLREHPGVRCVFVNGAAASAAYGRMRAPLPAVLLPSTSPANARLSFAEKLAAWRAVPEALDRQKGEPHGAVSHQEKCDL